MTDDALQKQHEEWLEKQKPYWDATPTPDTERFNLGKGRDDRLLSDKDIERRIMVQALEKYKREFLAQYSLDDALEICKEIRDETTRIIKQDCQKKIEGIFEEIESLLELPHDWEKGMFTRDIWCNKWQSLKQTHLGGESKER